MTVTSKLLLYKYLLILLIYKYTYHTELITNFNCGYDNILQASWQNHY